MATVLTAADVPVNEYGLGYPDQSVLCGVDSTAQAELVCWEADRVALVIAESQAQAEAAAKLIHVDYEPLPIVTDPVAAMQPDAPILHPNPFRFADGERDRSSNVLLAYRLQRGDLDAGFAAADVVVEATYRTQAQEHAYLQPEAGLAHVRPDGRVEVICAGQWMHEEREQIAHALGLPEEQVVVRFPAIGGAFGGREDISIQIVLALAALKTGRPVKTVWSRDESIRGHHKRHPYVIHAKWGATRDGKIVAAQMDVTSDAGAYASTSTKVLGNSLLAALGPYDIPNVLVDARTVYTNNTPSGAFPRLWRAAGPFRRRGAGQQAGGGAGHGPGRVAEPQHLARGHDHRHAQHRARRLYRRARAGRSGPSRRLASVRRRGLATGRWRVHRGCGVRPYPHVAGRRRRRAGPRQRPRGLLQERGL